MRRFTSSANAGLRGGLTSISIRGGDPNFSLLLLDGVPINDITDQLGGTADLSAVLPVDVGRIEVVRGPMSAVYGSEAIGGVINIISPEEETRRIDLRLAGGNFGTFEGRLHAGGQAGRIGYSFGVGGVRIGEQLERDSFAVVDSGGRMLFRGSQNTSLVATLRLRHLEASAFPANSGGPVYALNRELEDRTLSSGLGSQWKRATDHQSSRIEADFFRQRQQQDSPAIFDQLPPSFQTVPATFSETDLRRSRVNVANSFVTGDLTLTAGASYRHEAGSNEGTIDQVGPSDYRLVRNTGAIFGEALWDRRYWSIAAAIRSHWCQRRAATDEPAARSLRRGSAFRDADPRVLGARLQVAVLLRAGSSAGREPAPAAGAERSGRPDLRAALDYRHLAALPCIVRFTATWSDFSPQIFRLVNRNEVLARGVDFEWLYNIRQRLRLEAHSNYVSATLQSSPSRCATGRAGAPASMRIRHHPAHEFLRRDALGLFPV